MLQSSVQLWNAISKDYQSWALWDNQMILERQHVLPIRDLERQPYFQVPVGTDYQLIERRFS